MSKLLFIILFLGISIWGYPKELKQTSKLIKGQLENGLTYYIYPNNFPKGEAVYRLFIKSGSVLEDENQRGLAHFLEHMAFNGTKHFSGNSLTGFLESKGAKFGVDLNAHTSMNETVYKLQLPSSDPAFVDSTMMVLSDWAGGLSLDSIQIEEERGVILSEWLSKEGPKHDAQNAFLLELLNNSRYSQRLTIGDTAVIRHFPHQLIRNFYQTWYDPSLMAVAVVGDVNPKMVEQLIQKWFSSLKSVRTQNFPTYNIDDYLDVKVRKLSHESLDKIELDVVQLLDRPSSVKTEEDYPAYLERSLLNRLIRERFSSLSFSNPPYSKASYSYSSFLNVKGMLGGSVELVPDKISEGITFFATEAERIFRYGFVPVEIEKVRKKYLRELRNAVESKTPQESASLMNDVYADFYVGNKIIDMKEEYRLASKYIGQMDSVAFVSLLKTIRKPEKTHYLLTSFDKVAEQLPTEDQLKALFDSIQKADIKPFVKNIQVPESLLSKEPVPGKIVSRQKIDALGAESLVLSNGAKVIFKPSSLDKDNVQLSGFRRGGLYALDSIDYVNGVFAGSVVPISGAGCLSREEISHYLAGKSVSMRFLLEKTRSGVVGGSAKKDMEEMFRLLYLKWTQPKADSVLFCQIKDKTIEKYLTENKTETDRYYKDLELLLNGNSYVTREMTDKVIESDLKFERLVSVFNANFGSAKDYNFLLIGDCTFDEVKPFILKYLGGLPSGKVDNQYMYQGPVIPSGNMDYIKSVGDNPRSTVSLIFQNTKIGIDINSFKLQSDLAEEIVRNRLLKTLREEMGMIYSVSVSVSATKYPADLQRSTIRFSCKPEDVDVLINRTMNELKDMADHPESFESVLADAKLNLIKKWKINIQKNTYWSGAIRSAVYNEDYDWNFMLHYEELVNAVSKETVAETIRKSLLEISLVKSVLNPKSKNKK